MTSAQMLAKLGMMLDDANAAGFWTDAQKYKELAEGQNEIVKEALNRMWGSMEVPFVISPLAKEYVTASSANAYYSLQADELYTISIDYAKENGTEYPCRLIGMNRNVDFTHLNTYTTGTITDPIAEFKDIGGTQGWYFTPATGTNYSATTKYILQPTDIAAGQEPVIANNGHTAIVQFAFATLLSKDEDTDTRARSTEELTKFYKMVETLLGEKREESEPELNIQII